MAIDSLGRKIDYLRISVTDRCNFRCLYCMPEEGVVSTPHGNILSIEEIIRFSKVAAQEGIVNFRVTGGEPLVRKGIVDLIRGLSQIEGCESLAMTTNASLLSPIAQELKDAGLTRINISLDSLHEDTFKYLTRRGSLADTLEGIEASFRVGFDPVKINCVVIRSLKQDFLKFVHMTLERPLHVRFIEFMPIGHQAGIDHAGWTHEDVIPSEELRQHISELCEKAGLGSLVPVQKGDAPAGSGPAAYWKIPGAAGTIGFISPLSNHFCGSCNKLRLTADGFLRPCLFSDLEFKVRDAVRYGSDDDIRQVLYESLNTKPDEHHNRVGTDRDMSKIGG